MSVRSTPGIRGLSPLQVRRTLRVLYVINGLGTGGAERSLLEMLPRLIALGVEPRVACLYRRGEGVESLVGQTAGAEVVFIDRRSLLGRVYRLRREIRKHRPDVVHTVIFESDICGRLASWKAGPVVLTSLVNTSYEPVRLHDPRISRTKLRVAKLLDGWTARHFTHHFHAISETTKSSAVANLHIDPKRITVIPRGRDRKRLGWRSAERRRRSRRSLGVDDDCHLVVTVGRQEYQKGQKYLLLALPELLRKHVRLQVMIAGRDGAATADLRAIVEEQRVSAVVHFLGHREDVPDLLAAADVFVFPSLYEGLGGAMLEAMALGVPIVASDIPAVRETLFANHLGYLVEPADHIALAAAIDFVLSRDAFERDRLAAVTEEAFASRFDIDSVSQRLVHLYALVAGEPDVVHR